jgi:hypothetical protein
MHLHLLYRTGITAFLTGVNNGQPEDMYPRAPVAADFPENGYT